MDPQLFDILRDMRNEMTRNHTEVVQRLTAVETRINESPTAELEDRVRKLEGWKSKASGVVIAANLMIASAIAWLGNRH